MTLSNFDWTDKLSAKWYIMLPSGHEGPYPLNTLNEKFLSGVLNGKTLIWCEGLKQPVEIQEALHLAVKGDEPPPLPHEEIPDLPSEAQSITEDEEPRSARAGKKKWIAALGIILIASGGVFQWIKSQEKFVIRRLAGMSPEVQQKIESESRFEGWDKKIFLKEYVSLDMSRIWLVNEGFQRCEVEAAFTSLKDKLLAVSDGEKVSFKSKGLLSNHIVEFSSFDFVTGNKIIPGMYDLELKAINCEWDGLTVNLANHFNAPEKSYAANMKVILFGKGPAEFNRILDRLIKKRQEIELKAQDQEDLFWLDLQQKFQTLLAVTLQIEQLFVDFLDKGPNSFRANRLEMEAAYTKKFGSFLTKFVTSNESYFKELGKTSLTNLYEKQSYESLVRLSSKKIGHESMQLIEEFQKQKKAPSVAVVENYKKKVQASFGLLKEELNLKIMKITDDRSMSKK